MQLGAPIIASCGARPRRAAVERRVGSAGPHVGVACLRRQGLEDMGAIAGYRATINRVLTARWSFRRCADVVTCLSCEPTRRSDVGPGI